MSTQFKRGDVVGYIYAQPGNDTTYLLLAAVRSEDADAWDVTFNMKVPGVKLSKLWLASERELDSRISYLNSERVGTFSVRQLADEARQTLLAKGES